MRKMHGQTTLKFPYGKKFTVFPSVLLYLFLSNTAILKKHEIKVSNKSIGSSEYLLFASSQIIQTYFNLKVPLNYLTGGRKINL